MQRFDFTRQPDLSSPTAIYLQLLEIIRSQITNGTLPTGTLLPSESEFCAHYGISRTTVRQTLASLEKQGLVLRRRGLGTFVSEPKVQRKLDNLYSFTADMRSLGLTPSSKLVSFQMISQEKCPFAGVALGESLYELVRLRLANGRPMLLEHTYLPAAQCPGATAELFLQNPLYEVLRARYGLQPHVAVETYEPVLLTTQEAGLLGCGKNTPAFLIHRSTEEVNGQQMEYTVSVTPGERTRFQVTLYRDSANVQRTTGLQV